MGAARDRGGAPGHGRARRRDHAFHRAVAAFGRPGRDAPAPARYRRYLYGPTPGRVWQLTGTTVDDQLWLLAGLTSPGSPLSAASRSYELGLMRHVAAGRWWGVTAAATPGSSPAVADGSLPGPSRAGITWVIDSIGVLYQAGHQVLVAILSDGEPTEYAGTDQVGAAAAVSAVTGGRGAQPARGSGGM